jgi:hypothetical protein
MFYAIFRGLSIKKTLFVFFLILLIFISSTSVASASGISGFFNTIKDFFFGQDAPVVVPMSQTSLSVESFPSFIKTDGLTKNLAPAQYNPMSSGLTVDEVNALIAKALKNASKNAGPKGPKGDKGDAGTPGAQVTMNSSGNSQTLVVGGYPIQSYFTPNVATGFSGGSMAGYTELGAKNLSVSENAKLNNLTTSGTITASGAVNLLGGATVSGFNPNVAGSLTQGFISNTIDTSVFGGLGFVLGDDGLARVAYVGTSPASLNYAVCNDEDCSDPDITNFVDEIYSATAGGQIMTLGPDGFARILYQDIDQALQFVRCEDESCDTRTTTLIDNNIDNSPGAYGQAVVIGQDDLPRVLYANCGTDYDVHFVRFTGEDNPSVNTNLTDVGVDINCSPYDETNIVIGPDGFARIVYMDGLNDDYLKLARCTDADCTTPVITVIDDNVDGPGGYGVDLKIGSDGFLRIAYVDYRIGYNLHYAVCDDIDCTSPTLIELISTDGNSYNGPSLALRDGDLPSILTNDSSGNTKIINCSTTNCSAYENVELDDVGIDNGAAIEIGEDGLPVFMYMNDNIIFGRLINLGGVDTVSGSDLGSSSSKFGQIYATRLNVDQLYLDGSILTPSPWETFADNLYFNTGNVGIGTSAPDRLLTIAGDGDIMRLISSDGASYMDFRAEGADGYISSFGQNFLILQGAGQGVKLQKYSGMGVSVILGANDKVGFNRDSSTDGKFSIFTNSIDRFVIDSAGKIGIDIATPSNTISFGGNNPRIIKIEDSTAFSQGNSLTLQAGSGGVKGVNSDRDGGDLILSGGDVIGNGNSKIQFKTAGGNASSITVYSPTTRMVIDGSGNVGIGGTTPLTKLDVAVGSGVTSGIRINYATGITSEGLDLFYNNSGDTNAYIQSRFDSNQAKMSFIMKASGTPVNAMTILGNGNIGIAMTNPSVALDVTGDIEYTGTITDVSDERLKENITDFSGSGLEIIDSIGVKSFNMIGSSRVETGFIAQNVKEFFAESVSVIDPEHEYLGVSYVSFVPILTKAVQELSQKFKGFTTELVAWFANSANGITDFFANRVHTKEFCISDENGETCISKNQLDQILQNQNINSNTPPPQPEDPEPNGDDSEEPPSETPPPESTP